MSNLVERAFEVDAILLGTPETHQVLIAAGGTLPHVAVGAFQGDVVYFRSSGEQFKKTGLGDLEADWPQAKVAATDQEIQQAAGGAGAGGGHVPVCLTDASTVNLIEVEGDYLPVLMADGQINQIKLT